MPKINAPRTETLSFDEVCILVDALDAYIHSCYEQEMDTRPSGRDIIKKAEKLHKRLDT